MAKKGPNLKPNKPTQDGICQEKNIYTLKWGVNADYSFSGSTSSIVLGPSIYMGKTLKSEREFIHAFNLNAGFTWSNHDLKEEKETTYAGVIPLYPQTQGKIERYYRTIKKGVSMSIIIIPRI